MNDGQLSSHCERYKIFFYVRKTFIISELTRPARESNKLSIFIYHISPLKKKKCDKFLEQLARGKRKVVLKSKVATSQNN